MPLHQKERAMHALNALLWGFPVGQGLVVSLVVYDLAAFSPLCFYHWLIAAPVLATVPGHGVDSCLSVACPQCCCFTVSNSIHFVHLPLTSELRKLRLCALIKHACMHAWQALKRFGGGKVNAAALSNVCGMGGEKIESAKKAFKDKTIHSAWSSCPIAPGYIAADCYFSFLFGGDRWRWWAPLKCPNCPYQRVE